MLEIGIDNWGGGGVMSAQQAKYGIIPNNLSVKLYINYDLYFLVSSLSFYMFIFPIELKSFVLFLKINFTFITNILWALGASTISRAKFDTYFRIIENYIHRQVGG